MRRNVAGSHAHRGRDRRQRQQFHRRDVGRARGNERAVVIRMARISVVSPGVQVELERFATLAWRLYTVLDELERGGAGALGPVLVEWRQQARSDERRLSELLMRLETAAEES